MNYAKKFPVIDLGNYILREQTIADTEDFFRYYSDPEVNQFIISEIPFDMEEARKEISYWINIFHYGDGIYFGIAEKSTNKLIGSIGLSSINRYHNRIELSYDLAKEYWNRGIMTAAIKAVLKHGFEEMKINRIEAYSVQENKASRAVLKKCGFNLEGELKQHRRFKGSYRDIGIFSIVYQDYLNFSH